MTPTTSFRSLSLSLCASSTCAPTATPISIRPLLNSCNRFYGLSFSSSSSLTSTTSSSSFGPENLVFASRNQSLSIKVFNFVAFYAEFQLCGRNSKTHVPLVGNLLNLMSLAVDWELGFSICAIDWDYSLCGLFGAQRRLTSVLCLSSQCPTLIEAKLL